MNPTYSTSQRLLEYMAISLFVLLMGWGVWRLHGVAEGSIFSVLLLAFPLGWLVTDILSGLLHWAFDTLGSVSTPLLGRSFIRPFREHHIDPQAMTRHDFVETHGASCLAAIPFLLVANVMPIESMGSIILQAFLLSLGCGALVTNQCHKWAHMDDSMLPVAVRWAQGCHLVLPRWHHKLHHTSPFNSHFCMTCGWFNPLLNFVLKKCR